MNKIKFYLVSILVALVFVSCEPETETQTTIVDFEDVALTLGISTDTSFTSKNSIFSGNPLEFWNGGIVCSSKNDTVTSGYLNQFSCIAGSGAFNSTNFGVIYSLGTFTCPANDGANYSIKSIMINNNTYAYMDIKKGSGLSEKFIAGDWFKVSITGYLGNIKTSTVDYYLADFRDGKSIILNEWKKVDLTALGKVDKVAFTFDSSDKGEWGINTPTYVCIDNIEFTQTLSTK